MDEEELEAFQNWMKDDDPTDYTFGTISNYRQYISHLERPIDPEEDDSDTILDLFEQAGKVDAKLSAFRKYLQYLKEKKATNEIQKQKLDAMQTRIANITEAEA